ncbi:MAG: copper resistance system multicopper oxidase [Gammaproteobacteria bacterium]|nr:copper resistance system multicopper oxidase [Gammaproteobacteria bacterium]
MAKGERGPYGLTRRRFLQVMTGLGLLGSWHSLMPAYARPVGGQATALRVTDSGVDLAIARTTIDIGGRVGSALTINGTVPGPLLRFREGEWATLRVTNRLEEMTTLHWHGLRVPQDMDGVAGLSFPGIKPGETFTYRFRPKQNGTYWYHSHQGLQEQLGHYAPLIIEPAAADPVAYDREYIVFLSDWTFEDPEAVLGKLKKQSDYYNFQQRTLGDLLRDAQRYGWRAALQDRAMWGRMRMSPADIADVTGYAYTYLLNGLPPQDNWTALFRPGERVRLRFINGAASTFFNVRIPGLPLTVVQADGQNIQPVTVDEFQIAVAETYDVIVQPQEERAYTLFAEAMDRSGYTRATLAPRLGMSAPIPPLRERPLRTMIDMGMEMEEMDGMAMPGMAMGEEAMGGHAAGEAGMTMGDGAMAPADQGAVSGIPKNEAAMSGGAHAGMPGMEQAGPIVARHGPDTHGPANSTVATVQRNRLSERGAGLEQVEHRVLVYTDLKSLEPNTDLRPPGREIEFHLTGNMETFMWGFDGKKFSEVKEPIFLDYGERVRITLVNDTMMEHPMHLHGMFKEILNGAEPAHRPRKHTISVKPAERLSFDITADAPGNWAFHCHLLYHMEAGMLRVVNVGLPPQEGRP